MCVCLGPVRVQKEDTEEEKVSRKSVLNKQNIYKISVSTGSRSVRPKLSGLTAGRKSVFVVRPTDRSSVVLDHFGGSGA